jgi:hypothetical protein
MADYGNYTTYHFDDVDEMSDYESTGAPPPPPPADDYAVAKGSSRAVDGVPKDLEGHSEYDKLNSTMNTTSGDAYDDDGEEDQSVEIPPTKVVEDMMRREQEAQVEKGGKRVLCLTALLCLLLSMGIILAAGYGTGAFDTSSSETKTSAAITVDGYTPGQIPGETETPDEEYEEANFDERPSEGPADTASTSSARGQAMREYLGTVAIAGANSFADLASPESLALQWLILEDPLKLDATKEEDQFQITQRYALVTLWYNSAFTWANETNWLIGEECTWHGVFCTSLTTDISAGNASSISKRQGSGSGVQVVSGINLEGNNVQGNIPADIALLSFVTSLNLADNVLEGSLPDSLTQMTALEEIYLDRNMLTQDLSTYDFSPLATTLTLLDLSSNLFSGNLPTSLWKLFNLELLVIDNNKFTGSLNDDVSLLTKLSKSS